jgi:hypothetical protein
MNRAKPTNWVRMNGLADAAPAEDRAVLLGVHDALQAHRAGLDHDADHREHERQLVGDELRGGAQRAHQRELVGARPAGHQHADDRQARHRERVEHADVERLRRRRADPARRDHDEHEERRQHDDRGRQREDAPVGLVGMMSSFCMNFMPSPMSWYQPWKPPGSIGPSRLCMWTEHLPRLTLVPVARGEQVRDRGAHGVLVRQPHLHAHVVMMRGGEQVREDLEAALGAPVDAAGEVAVVAGEPGVVAEEPHELAVALRAHGDHGMAVLLCRVPDVVPELRPQTGSDLLRRERAG